MSRLQSTKDPHTGESVHRATTASGVEVALVRTPGYAQAGGWFGLRFGSTDTRFRTADGKDVEVPDGSAHFLEHKLFEGREEKVFDRFGKLGADFNGGTGFFETSYYFLSAGRFAESLEVLLDFVQHPLITQERVDKEKGIIEQEVRMYEDQPGFRSYMLLHRALFQRHPIRVPPGGFVESVRATTAEDLQQCFDAFYRPQNFKLALSGDFDPEAVLDQVEGLLDPPQPGSGVHQDPDEPEDIAAPWLEEEFAVERPRVSIGWRERAGNGLGAAMLRRQQVSAFVMSLLFDVSSPYHEDLYLRGVVDDSFGAHYSCDASYGYAAASGRCDDPARFVDEVRGTAARFLKRGPRQEDLERVVRAAWGGAVTSLQGPRALGSAALSASLEGYDPFAAFGIYQTITRDEVVERAQELLDPARSAVAVLRPAG